MTGRRARARTVSGAMALSLAVAAAATTSSCTTEHAARGRLGGDTATATAPTVPASTSSTSTSTSTSTTVVPPALPRVSSVLVAGDSVAMGEAPAILAALTAAGVRAVSVAFIGAGILAEPADPLAKYREQLVAQEPDLVVYQLSVWDRGSAEAQRAVYREFADLVVGSGAQLVFVTAPPFERPADYGHLDALRTIAGALADERPGTIHLLDATAAWGATFTRDIGDDGAIDRMPDGIHVCPAGALRMTTWLLAELLERFDGMRRPADAEWVFGPWNGSSAYATPPGACLPVAGS